MKLLIPAPALLYKSSRELIPLQCELCNTTFYRTKHEVVRAIKTKKKTQYNCKFCSRSCRDKSRTTRLQVECKLCNSIFEKFLYEIKKSKNNFCSSSCAATYNNTHKTKGTRKSKLECWLETKLPMLYPSLEFHFNRKDAINSELDIYIPSLKLAFELNGIFHYEPIYGAEKLGQIQNNDTRKFQACIENKIELCIIDTSKLSYFKESSAIKFLDIITRIINLKT